MYNTTIMVINRGELGKVKHDYTKRDGGFWFPTLNLRIEAIQNKGNGDYPIGERMAELVSQGHGVRDAYVQAKKEYLNSLNNDGQ